MATALDTARFQFIAYALNGSGGFSPAVTADTLDGRNARLTGASYLVRYPRESDEKFARRNQVAWYRNFLRPACQRFAGYLAKKPPTRDIAHPLLQSLLDDCDWRGNALDVFWSSFAIDAKARGSMLVVVDMPRALPGNRAEQLTQRAFPYLQTIEPERVIAYTLNVYGRLDLVAIADSNDRGEPIYRCWSTVEWWTQKPGAIGDPALRLDGDTHPLGVCPVLAFTEMGDFPHLGDFAQIADLSRRYFNAASERDEILRAQTFSLLTYQVPPEEVGFEPSQVAEAIGTHNMLIHRGDVPAFIAPPDGPATIYGEVLAQIEETIRRIAMTVEQPTTAESGVALTIRFQELNSTLCAFARRMEDLERRVWDLACRWLGIAQQPDIAWAKSYELADVATEMSVLQNMQASGFPDEVVRAQMSNLVGLQFSNLDADTVAALNAALDQTAHDRQPRQTNGEPV